jgi:hypothetical protein
MSLATKLFVLASTSLVGLALSAQPAVANTQEKTFNEVHFRYVESGVCSFDLKVHLDGFYKSVNYYDNGGSLYKTINTPGGGGPFAVTYTANGITLVQQSEAFSEVITYDRDGSVKTYTARGPVARYTVPGEGIVLLNVGTATWDEPEENLLFMAGPHQAATGDFDAFCAAFG